MNVVAEAPVVPNLPRMRRCGQCQGLGHDRRNCPENPNQGNDGREGANRGRGRGGRGCGRGRVAAAPQNPVVNISY